MATKKQTTSKSKRFSVSQLKDQVEAYNEFIEIPVSSQGEEYIVKMWPFFSPEKTRDCVNTIVEFYQLAGKEKLEIPQIEESDLIGYFICKYFTDMLFTSSKKAKNIYAEFKMVINAPLFKTLLETFPKESIQTIYDRIFEVSEASVSLQSQFKVVQELIQNLPLENREIIEKMWANKTKEQKQED